MVRIIVSLLLFVPFALSAQRAHKLNLKSFKIATLSDSLRETSGLFFQKDQLFTFNDGGNSATLFQINKKKGKILGTTAIALPNRDWEALSGDENTLYLGDFGNNLGNRKDVAIYKITNDSIVSIPYYYPEQNDFSLRINSHNFDAEALAFFNGRLHIFTKEWISGNTSHYTVNPEQNKEQKAEKLESYRIGYLVTDAAYNKGKLYLVGYTKTGRLLLSLFQDDGTGRFFSGKPQVYHLGSALRFGQVEGITVNAEGIYLSSERFSTPLGTVLPTLYFIPKIRLQAEIFEK